MLTASVQGMVTQQGALAYVATKHGLVGLVAGMAMDEAAHEQALRAQPAEFNFATSAPHFGIKARRSK